VRRVRAATLFSSGYGAGGTLPDEGWTMVVYTTASPATDPSAATATDIFRQFTSIVSPEHSLEH
jgi:D-alanyl-D-alanine carboxypeptidase